jgi:RimJ/RimL family protein N-acetyltransferase
MNHGLASLSAKLETENEYPGNRNTYVVLRTPRKQSPATISDSAVRAHFWKPTWTSVFPPHNRSLLFLEHWLLDRLSVYRNSCYSVLTIEDDDRQVVHRTCIYPASPQYPFMKSSDVQVGSVFTAPAWRRKGFATVGIRLCLSRLNNQEGSVFYIARTENAAGIQLAAKTGFSRVGIATKWPSRRFGYYIIH